jgi:hypothetical protein
MIPLSDKVPGRASEPSLTRVDDGGDYGTFRGWRLGSLGFSRGCEYIGGRARSVGTQGAHTLGRRGQGARATTRCGRLVALLRLPFGLRERVRKYELWLLFRPIPRIFPSVIIWNRKTAENKNWQYGMSHPKILECENK